MPLAVVYEKRGLHVTYDDDRRVLFVGPKALRSYGRTHSIRRWKERSARLEARLPGEYAPFG